MLPTTDAPCPACGAPVAQRAATGRPRVFCDQACRAAAYRRRSQARTEAEIERAIALITSLSAAASLTPDD